MLLNTDPADVRVRMGTLILDRDFSHWLRITFPNGGTFHQVWEQCPWSDWLWCWVEQLSHWADPYLPVEWSDDAEILRERYPYPVVEEWIGRLMEGRPEVLEHLD